MNRIGIIAAILMTMSIIPSCVRDIVMDAEEKPQVVVSCVLSDDPVQTLKLSFTKGASLKEAPQLTEAVATLYDGGYRIGEFMKLEDGIWILDHAAVPGHEYRLEVQVPGYEMIYAEQRMPSQAASVDVQYFCNIGDYIEPWSGWVSVSDPAGDWTYLYWPEDEEQPDVEVFYHLTSSVPVWICAMNYNDETGLHELAEYICTDADADVINITDLAYEPLTKECPNPFKLRRSKADNISSETFYSARRMELYPNLTGRPLYSSYIHLSGGRHVFSISGSFTGNYYVGELYRPYPIYTKGDSEATEKKGYICFSTLSDDYEKFLIESHEHQQILESSDLSTIYLHDNIFTNITGGLGIFGAQLTVRCPWIPAYTYVDAGVPKDLDDEIDFYRDFFLL